MHDALSARIVAHLRATFSPPDVLAFCWPIKHEPDVRAVVDLGPNRHPRSACRSSWLKTRRWLSRVDRRYSLEADRYGIPTPVSGAWLVPDLILLPLERFRCRWLSPRLWRWLF
jgi:5-formyltetrahydrofolate cyclo-ligase